MPHEAGDTSILEPIGKLAKRGEDKLRVCASGERRPERTYRSPDGCWFVLGLLVEGGVDVVALKSNKLV